MLLAVATVLAGGCGSREPTADEQRVCSTLQQLVDDLDAGRGQEALATLPSLQEAVDSTSNERIAAAGGAFFEELFTDIDYSQLTLEETANLGTYYQQVMAQHLAEIANECDDIGAAIERQAPS